MMGWSPECYIQSFVEIGPPVLEKKALEGFLPYKGMNYVIRFSFPCTFKAFIQNLIQICIAVSEKIHFNFLYVHDFGPRSRNDIDLQYSHIFIYSIRYQLLLPFKSLTAIVSENSTVFTFS